MEITFVNAFTGEGQKCGVETCYYVTTPYALSAMPELKTETNTES